MTPPLGLVALNATFDKNPRLETVVGFFIKFGSGGVAAPPKDQGKAAALPYQIKWRRSQTRRCKKCMSTKTESKKKTERAEIGKAMEIQNPTKRVTVIPRLHHREPS